MVNLPDGKSNECAGLLIGSGDDPRLTHTALPLLPRAKLCRIDLYQRALSRLSIYGAKDFAVIRSVLTPAATSSIANTSISRSTCTRRVGWPVRRALAQAGEGG